MESDTPPDLRRMTNIPQLGRGRGMQPLSDLAGHGRGLAQSTEVQGIGQTRTFSGFGDAPSGRGETLEVTQPAFGRAQGLMAQSGLARRLVLSTPEVKVGVARGAIFTSLEPEQQPGPQSDPMTQQVTEETATTKPVKLRHSL